VPISVNESGGNVAFVGGKSLCVLGLASAACDDHDACGAWSTTVRRAGASLNERTARCGLELRRRASELFIAAPHGRDCDGDGRPRRQNPPGRNSPDRITLLGQNSPTSTGHCCQQR